MTPQERYAKALQELIEAQKAVEKDQGNPFNFGLPTHLGLSDDTFISEDELNKLSEKLESAASDNKKFAKIWNIGSEILIKAKALLM